MNPMRSNPLHVNVTISENDGLPFYIHSSISVYSGLRNKPTPHFDQNSHIDGSRNSNKPVAVAEFYR